MGRPRGAVRSTQDDFVADNSPRKSESPQTIAQNGIVDLFNRSRAFDRAWYTKLGSSSRLILGTTVFRKGRRRKEKERNGRIRKEEEGGGRRRKKEREKIIRKAKEG